MAQDLNDPEKRALLIGIDEYPHFAQSEQLHGCINDVELMAGILQHKFGFPPRNITMLKNKEATRAGILAGMDGLAGQVTQGDVVLIYYSGHGSQMRDREEDEPDGWDETIVSYDGGRDKPDQIPDITDDEIYERLLRLTAVTANVTFIFDSCFSGTIARDVFGTATRGVRRDERSVPELPPSPVTPGVAHCLPRNHGPSGWLPVSDRYVLVAACAHDETASEHRVSETGGKAIYGALTYFLAQELERAQPGSTYRDIFERASTQLTAAFRRQHPQLEGARDRELFGVRDIVPMRFVPVARRQSSQITLAGGAAHGITIGSDWAIYPPSTQEVTDETSRLGVVKIARVDAVSSRGSLIEEAALKAVTIGCRAVEQSHAPEEMTLLVALEAPEPYAMTAARLQTAVRNSKLLRLAGKDEIAGVCVYIIPPRARAEVKDPVPQLGVLAQPAWAVVGQDGRLAMPWHFIAETDAVSILLEDLEKLARYRNALGLRNLNENSRLKGKVELVLRRQEPDGTWAVAEFKPGGGHITFTEGARFAFEIVNRHTEPIYVSVLDFGLTGAISLLHPPAGSNEPLAAGGTLKVGMRPGELDPLFMPENFPYALEPAETQPAGGLEVFKLFATTYPADFGGLLQKGMRGAADKGAGTPTFEQLAIALTGFGERIHQVLFGLPTEDWTTVERPFFLRKGSPSLLPPGLKGGTMPS
ncbi:MAG: caspase family protein [Chloroflexi bacterium]|nr:caspase family protein [Chloroflexota bacterium]